ncbi:MAG: hypothetical protein NTX91_03205 [candidate division SR1 bacterium]|nr:hypothetical protein [candidate division SR1 bacterium]
MDDENILEENFLGEENTGGGIEAIMEKTSGYLSKLFDYFKEEDEKNIL